MHIMWQSQSYIDLIKTCTLKQLLTCSKTDTKCVPGYSQKDTESLACKIEMPEQISATLATPCVRVTNKPFVMIIYT